MTITENNWMDIGNTLINEVIGSAGLFIVIGLIIINYFGVKNNLPIQINLVLSFLFIGMTISYVYNALVWMIRLFMAGIIIYALFPKFFKR